MPEVVGDENRTNWVSSIPFLAMHLVPLAAIVTGVTWRAVALCAGLYVGRMFFITGAYHRYFAHRSYRAGRVVQFLLALGGTTAVQKGPLWWAGHHRAHHRYADTDLDPHSPMRGFWWSHVGWILSDRYKDTDLEAMADFARFPELRLLERYNAVPAWALAGACFAVAGWSGLVIGFGLSTVLVWHATFTVNSLAHVMGRRRYATTDTSRNSLSIALITMGEGWHNNHHHFPKSARQGFFWWEIDPTWYVLRGLAALGLVHDLRRPTPATLAAPRLRDGHFDIGTFRAHWAKAAAALPASALTGSIVDGVSSVGDAVAARRATLEATMATERAALEGCVASALTAAEALARQARHGRRELAQQE